MSASIDRPGSVSPASQPSLVRRGTRAGAASVGLWRDLAWTAGSFAVILALLFGLAPGQVGIGEAPRAHPALAALAD